MGYVTNTALYSKKPNECRPETVMPRGFFPSYEEVEIGLLKQRVVVLEKQIQQMEQEQYSMIVKPTLQEVELYTREGS